MKDNKISSEVCSEVEAKLTVSVKHLASMNLPGYPTSDRGWLDLVKREQWKFVEESTQGGKGGVKKMYIPPPEVMALINARKETAYSPPAEVSARLQARHEVAEAQPLLLAPDNSVMVPRYNVEASMGHGSVIDDEHIVEHLAFNATWVRKRLGANPKMLCLINAKGDSMYPTLCSGDLLLLNRSINQVIREAIYAFSIGSELRVKRMQPLSDGSVLIKSDNPLYSPETVTQDQIKQLNLLGMVVWFGREML